MYPELYLVTEGEDAGEPRRCKVLRRCRSRHRDDLMLINIEPPIIGQQYGLGDQDVHRLLIAPRFEGVSLFPVTEWPVHVYVCRLLVSGEPELVKDSEMELIRWGILHVNEEEAKRHVGMI